MKARAARMIALVMLASLWLPEDAEAMSCAIESTPLFAFGQYDPQSHYPHDIQTSFAIQCTPAFRGERLNLSISFSGLASGELKIRNPANGDLVRFSMYKDPARSQPLDAQSILSFSTLLLTTTTLSLPVYGRIPARQNVSVGNYQLNVGVILNF